VPFTLSSHINLALEQRAAEGRKNGNVWNASALLDEVAHPPLMEDAEDDEDADDMANLAAAVADAAPAAPVGRPRRAKAIAGVAAAAE